MLDMLIVALASYLLGSLPSGVIAGRIGKGLDIREHGSGNTGATNSFRVLGWKLGLSVAIADIAKGAVATVLVARLSFFPGAPLPSSLPFIVATLSVVLGHIKPAFAGFRGGRGFGTAAGAIGAAFPALIVPCLAAFLVALSLTGYVSLCAVVASFALPLSYFLAVEFFGLAFDPVILSFFVAVSALTAVGVRKKLALYFQGKAEVFEKVMILRARPRTETHR
jgi:acyl phosphate:glycerol-3-phosphate acyltransferase